jgi:hypothetical protein
VVAVDYPHTANAGHPDRDIHLISHPEPFLVPRQSGNVTSIEIFQQRGNADSIARRTALGDVIAAGLGKRMAGWMVAATPIEGEFPHAGANRATPGC